MTRARRSPSEVTQRVRGKIKPASELEQYQRFLFYGRAGAGKTRLAATAPDVLIVDVNDKGTDSVRKDINPHVYPVEFWAEINDVYWFLAEGNHDYKSVAIDGVTGMQNLCMKFVLGDESSRDASRDPDMPSRPVWGKVGELMKTQITNFRNLPMNVVFTALTRSRVSGEEEGDDDTLFIGPACSPSIAGHLEAAVGTIGYLTTRRTFVKDKATNKRKEVVRRRLITGPSERFSTKDRNNAFGEYVENPNVTKMLATIYSEE